MRVVVPEGEHPIVYVQTKMGSPRLTRSRLESYEAAFFNDSGLSPRERDLMRIRAVLETDCNLCAAARPAQDMPGYADEAIGDEVYEHALEYSTWPGYSERERVLIEFMERYMLAYRDVCVDDAFWDRMKANFCEAEIADACMLAGHWESARRTVHLLLGVDDICDIPEGEVPPSQHAVELGIGQPALR